MRNSAPIRPIPAALVLLLLAAGASEGQSLPPSSPTRVAAPFASRSSGAARQKKRARAAAAGDDQPYRAQVSLVDGLLAVTARNSSLNQILRDVAQLNRMTITGGVTEERVYGTYGPAPAGLILSQLLDGTQTNVLLRLDAHNVIQELVLTPRGGGPTPASPSAMAAADQVLESDLPPAPGGRRVPANSMRPQIPVGVALPQPPNDRPAPEPVPEGGAQSGTNAGTSGDTTQQSPNGVKTPEQMLEELKQREQQAADPASVPNPPESLPNFTPENPPATPPQ